jgi:glucose-6-phosphate 1-epimerase
MAKPNSQTGAVSFREGRGGLPLLEIATPWGRAEIYLHGAHVTQFQKTGEPPLLFTSAQSRFEPDAPIRGGIPVIFPWFGKPADKPCQHGFVRKRGWKLKEITTTPEGAITVRLALPPSAELPAAVTVEYFVTVRDTLTAELVVTNQTGGEYEFENCLHTYFGVGDINTASVVGLKGVDYLDAMDNFARKLEREAAIRFTCETDRVYLNTPHTIEIHDALLRRTIRVEKTGSLSTVVWNPWIAKAKAMADFGDEEYQQMVCVESGNVASNPNKLPAGQSSSLKVTLSSASLS